MDNDNMIDESKFPSNSILPSSSIDDASQKPTKVIKGTVIKREKPILMRIFGESMKGVGVFILWDVVVPAVKEMILDAIKNGGEMLLYGSEEKSSRIKRDRGRSVVEYNSIFDSRRRERYTITPKKASRFAFDDIALQTRDDAVQVLDNLLELIDQYGFARVSDFYEMVDVDGEYTDNKWGWDNLRTAEIKRVREGWILILPKPDPISD